MNIEFVAREIFSYFYQLAYKFKPLNPSLYGPEGMRVFKGFEERLKKEYGDSIGPQFIYDYTLFQFGRYITKIENNAFTSGGPITPAMVYGKKPHLEIYNKRNRDMEFMLNHSPLIKKYGASILNCQSATGIQFEIPFEKPKGYRDPTKAVASAGGNALDLCLEMTDLFDKNDPSCQRCSDAQKCAAKKLEIYL